MEKEYDFRYHKACDRWYNAGMEWTNPDAQHNWKGRYADEPFFEEMC